MVVHSWFDPRELTVMARLVREVENAGYRRPWPWTLRLAKLHERYLDQVCGQVIQTKEAIPR